MNYQKKLFRLLADLSASPVSQDSAVMHIADNTGIKPRVLRAQIKAVKQQAALASAADAPDIEAVTTGIHFDGTYYYRKEHDGIFGKLGREDVQLEFRQRGLSSKKVNGAEVAPTEQALHHVQTNARVVYAAPLCGRKAGCHIENGQAILATDSPRIVEAAPGNAASLVTFFANLLGQAAGDVHAEEQIRTFYAWLQRARRALTSPDQHLPGQMLALVGEADCGKTLAQSLITLMLGGRQADPSLWLTGASPFNGGIWGAEHWAASDSNIEDTLAARKMLRDRVKEATANESLGCHRKHREEITLRPIARLTLSANDDADSTFVLPFLDDSIKDKVIYLKCYKPPVPFPTETDVGAKAFFKSLTDAIPVFLHLVENFEVPVAMRKGRFGVKEFHHPALVELLVGANADSDLADILVKYFEPVAGTTTPVEIVGTAVQIYGLIVNSAGGENTLHRVCASPTKLGQALGRLSHADGWRQRITSEELRIGANRVRQTKWTILHDTGTAPTAAG
jgi:hypothetical protein